MSRERAKSAIKHLLLTETDIRSRLISDIVAREVAEAKGHTSDGRVTQRDVDDYIMAHHREIVAIADRTIDELCDKAIPGSRWKSLLGQFGVLAIVLVPPLGCLISYSIKLWKEPSLAIDEFSLCVSSILLLVALICASANAVFRDSLPK